MKLVFVKDRTSAGPLLNFTVGKVYEGEIVSNNLDDIYFICWDDNGNLEPIPIDNFKPRAE